MTESGVINKTTMVFGQMNEPPGARMRVGLTGPLPWLSTSVIKVERMSCYSSTTSSVPTQAGSEVSALLDVCRPQ